MRYRVITQRNHITGQLIVLRFQTLISRPLRNRDLIIYSYRPPIFGDFPHHAMISLYKFNFKRQSDFVCSALGNKKKGRYTYILPLFQDGSGHHKHIDCETENVASFDFSS